MLKKVGNVSVAAALLCLSMAAMADGGRHGRDRPFNAPEIDGANVVLGMTLLAGIVGIAKRRKAGK